MHYRIWWDSRAPGMGSSRSSSPFRRHANRHLLYVSSPHHFWKGQVCWNMLLLWCWLKETPTILLGIAQMQPGLPHSGSIQNSITLLLVGQTTQREGESVWNKLLARGHFSLCNRLWWRCCICIQPRPSYRDWALLIMHPCALLQKPSQSPTIAPCTKR